MRTHVQSPDPIVSDKQVSPPHQPFLPTPYSSHAKNMTGSKKPQKLSEQQLKLKSSSLEREKRLLDGRNRRKERRLNSTKQDSRRPLMKRKRERTSPMMSSWRGQRSRKRMSRRKRWVRFHIQTTVDKELMYTEAYRMSKQAYDDPMANYKDEEDL